MFEAIQAFFTADAHLPVWAVWYLCFFFMVPGMTIGIYIGKVAQRK